MGNSLAKVCFCYQEDHNSDLPASSGPHSGNYSRITDEQHGSKSPEKIKAHQHYSSNKYVSHSHKDHSSLQNSDQESHGINKGTNDEDNNGKYDDNEDDEVEIFEEESGGIVERKVKKNSIKPKKVCLLKRGYLSAITEEDDLIRDSMMLSKRERYSKIYSIVNNNNNSSLIVEEQENLEGGGGGGLLVDEARQTNERNTIKFVIEEMKAVEAMGIETVIDELLNIISKDEPMSDIQEGVKIPDVLPEYESICRNGLKKLLLVSVSDLTKEGFVQEYADPGEKGTIPDCQKYEEWLREALFEAKIKAKNNVSLKGKVEKQQENNQEKILEKPIDNGAADLKEIINNTDSTNALSDTDKTYLDSAVQQVSQRQLQGIEENNKKESSKINDKNNNNNNNDKNGDTFYVSSINNNENSFVNDSRDCIEPQEIKLVVSSQSKNITDNSNKNTKNTESFYARIFMKPVQEDKYKYFHLKSEYNLHGIDAKHMLDCMVNEQWSRENNQSIDVFESLGTFNDYKLLYIAYKKVLMTSPRDFLYLKCNKRLSSSLYLSLQVSVELDDYPEEKGKERAVVKLGGTLLKDEIKGDNDNKTDQQNSKLSVMSYTESNLKLTLNHKLILKPTVNEVKKYIQRLQHFIKDKQDKKVVIKEQKQ